MVTWNLPLKRMFPSQGLGAICLGLECRVDMGFALQPGQTPKHCPVAPKPRAVQFLSVIVPCCFWRISALEFPAVVTYDTRMLCAQFLPQQSHECFSRSRWRFQKYIVWKRWEAPIVLLLHGICPRNL